MSVQRAPLAQPGQPERLEPQPDECRPSQLHEPASLRGHELAGLTKFSGMV
jgi:hypothetical protein